MGSREHVAGQLHVRFWILQFLREKTCFNLLRVQKSILVEYVEVVIYDNLGVAS